MLITIIGGLSCSYAQVPTNGLVGYWPFNGNANDYSGNNNNGIAYGVTLTYDRFGHANCAYSFNGIDNYIYIGNTVIPSNITISFWFISNSTKQTMSMIRSSNWGYSCVLNYNYGGTVCNLLTDCYINSSKLYAAELQTKYNDSIWHNLVISYDGLYYKTYIDKNLVYSKDSLGSGAIYYSPGTLAFGRDGGNSGFYYNGALDDIRIYNRALSPSEVIALYNESALSIKDLSGIDNLIYIYPNPVMDIMQIQTALRILKVEITDITGRQLYSTNSKTIDTHNFAKGVYFIKATTENGTAVRRFVKE